MTCFLGLTGSIGMGKSTTAGMFTELGCPVWDADAAVHRLYQGPAVQAVETAFPGTTGPAGVDRQALKAALAADPAALKRLEAIVHPLVAADRAAFRAHVTAPLAVLDIPLLFETGADAEMDATAVVSAPADIQRQRVLARGTMTAQQLDLILSRQMPDAEKRARADYIIPTNDMDSARKAVRAIYAELTGQPDA
ncbi:MAG: dephospho-CoA kinase [Paracoccus sp. (in: a-proteobacteria)]|uniref:dephospho-CoA kinase n=1 Tax=Paracoccus sp. TaxID=267 RepID=UPI0026DEDA39|nr:dephospho-CoA kinase [Paracoccus sp. (in: a-proteobacteria)]MDO5621640.1 dephospho-CoA kinase [Paracoccus sp. (in: a-proteobacteria)]